MAFELTSLFPTEVDLDLVREFDAPRALVWKAWTDPEMVRRWWGPLGFDAPECEMDVRPGGKYRIVARAPDGTSFPVRGTYLEIELEKRLVMTDNADEMPDFWRKALNKRRKAAPDEAPAEIVLTLTLEDRDEGTIMTLTSRFATEADRAAALDMGTVETWAQSFTKMESVLAEQEKSKE